MDGTGVDMGVDRAFAQEGFIYKVGANRNMGSRARSFRVGGLGDKTVCENKVHKASRLLLNLLVPNAQFLRECFSVAKKRAIFCNWS